MSAHSYGPMPNLPTVITTPEPLVVPKVHERPKATRIVGFESEDEGRPLIILVIDGNEEVREYRASIAQAPQALSRERILSDPGPPGPEGRLGFYPDEFEKGRPIYVAVYGLDSRGEPGTCRVWVGWWRDGEIHAQTDMTWVPPDTVDPSVDGYGPP